MKPFRHDALDKPIMLPYVKIVCPSCNGEGTHFRSDLDESRLVDMMEEDGDYDGLYNYRRGDYDQVCTQCNGNNVVDDWDWEYAAKHYPDELKAISDWSEQVRLDEQYAEAERRFCGGW